jgi:hypothetical protein
MARCCLSRRWPLDHVALPIAHRIDLWRPPAPGTPPRPNRLLVPALRNGVSDTTMTQQPTAGAIAVATVGNQMGWALAGPTWSRAEHPDAVQQRSQLGALMALPSSDQHPKRPATVTSQVDLGGQPARLRPNAWPSSDGEPRQLLVPFSGAGGVLVSTDDGGVHHDLPVDLPDRIRAGPGMSQQPLPGPVSLPAAEPLIAGLPGSMALGQVPPGHPSGQLPQDPVRPGGGRPTGHQGSRWPAAAARSRPRPSR